jgi:rhodanese-related sulfurtransferase
MSPAELSNLTNFQLLDVRLPDDFEAMHLTQARNNCVFEISFLNRLAETAPDLPLPVPRPSTDHFSTGKGITDPDLSTEPTTALQIFAS